MYKMCEIYQKNFIYQWIEISIRCIMQLGDINIKVLFIYVFLIGSIPTVSSDIQNALESWDLCISQMKTMNGTLTIK